MAYVDKETKARVVAALKKAFGTEPKKRGFYYTVSVNNHSTLVVTISKGTIDFLGNAVENATPGSAFAEYPERTYLSVNEHVIERMFTGKACSTLIKIRECMNLGNHNNSDIMTDYFDVGWYLSINIGKFDKPYIVLAA